MKMDDIRLFDLKVGDSVRGYKAGNKNRVARTVVVELYDTYYLDKRNDRWDLATGWPQREDGSVNTKANCRMIAKMTTQELLALKAEREAERGVKAPVKAQPVAATEPGSGAVLPVAGAPAPVGAPEPVQVATGGCPTLDVLEALLSIKSGDKIKLSDGTVSAVLGVIVGGDGDVTEFKLKIQGIYTTWVASTGYREGQERVGPWVVEVIKEGADPKAARYPGMPFYAGFFDDIQVGDVYEISDGSHITVWYVVYEEGRPVLCIDEEDACVWSLAIGLPSNQAYPDKSPHIVRRVKVAPKTREVSRLPEIKRQMTRSGLREYIGPDARAGDQFRVVLNDGELGLEPVESYEVSLMKTLKAFSEAKLNDAKPSDLALLRAILEHIGHA